MSESTEPGGRRGAGDGRAAGATLPPRWFIRGAWRLHRTLYRGTGGRLGLRRPVRGGKMGMLQLRTVGRRSGEERAVILGYWEDRGRLITLAMNGWGTADPAWWLNLTAQPEAVVDMVDGSRPVRASAAEGAERDRLWAGFADYAGWGDDLEALARLRQRDTTVVVLEPR